jgi:hypothetical protein
MAYSRNPLNYPPALHTLVSRFTSAPPALTFTFASHHDAYALQMKFYAFIRALSHRAGELRKLKQIDEAKRWENLETLARTRQLEIRQASLEHWELIFRTRDAAPEIQTLLAQLGEMDLTPPPPIDYDNPFATSPSTPATREMEEKEIFNIMLTTATASPVSQTHLDFFKPSPLDQDFVIESTPPQSDVKK